MEDKLCYYCMKTTYWKNECLFLKKDNKNRNVKPYKPMGKEDNDEYATNVVSDGELICISQCKTHACVPLLLLMKWNGLLILAPHSILHHIESSCLLTRLLIFVW